MEVNDPYTIDPCGHSFCKSCCQKSKQCPICRQAVVKLIRVYGIADSLHREEPKNKHPLREKLVQSIQHAEQDVKKLLEADIDEFIRCSRIRQYYYPKKINLKSSRVKEIFNEYQQIFNDLLKIDILTSGEGYLIMLVDPIKM